MSRPITIPLSAVRANDVITLPGAPERSTVTSNNWVTAETMFRLVLAGQKPRLLRGGGDVVLHERPGYGPFDHVYGVGDRVTFWNNVRRHEGVGVVVEVYDYRDELVSPGLVYEVRHIYGKATLGPENMTPDPTPAPAPGQRWVSDSTGHVVDVTGTEMDGLVAVTRQCGTVVLGAPHWRILAPGETPEQSPADTPPTPAEEPADPWQQLLAAAVAMPL